MTASILSALPMESSRMEPRAGSRREGEILASAYHVPVSPVKAKPCFVSESIAWCRRHGFAASDHLRFAARPRPRSTGGDCLRAGARRAQLGRIFSVIATPLAHGALPIRRTRAGPPAPRKRPTRAVPRDTCASSVASGGSVEFLPLDGRECNDDVHPASPRARSFAQMTWAPGCHVVCPAGIT